MSDPKFISNSRRANFDAWEDAASKDRQTQRERIASEVFLAALGSTENFRDKIFLKGGVLVGVVYESGRNTADLDFSTTLQPSNEFLEQLEKELVAALPLAAAQVGSPGTLIRVQSVKYRPRRGNFVDADAPSIEVKFAFAESGTESENNLKSGNSHDIIYADISFNEEIFSVEEICIGETGVSFFAYSKCDLIAEKLRSILQQKIRNRKRRQDVYDLWFIFKNYEVSDDEIGQIRTTFMQKCKSRGFEPNKDSLADSEVIDRSRSEWSTLEAEVAHLPEFEEAYGTVQVFYDRLWN